MNLVTGAMGSLLPKLAKLLNDEYKLPKNVKEAVRSLEKEMKSMHAALRKVAEVPHDQLDEQVKLWAGEVRELSFDMEDVVDKFLVRVDDGDDSEPATKSNRLKQLADKMAGLFTKGKARHQIADVIKNINRQVQEVADRRGRYTVDSIVARPPAAVTPIDPRLGSLYKELTELVGIPGKRDQELMKLLSEGDDETKNKLRVVSVVGFGGLGKTTLVKTVYDKIKGDFDCSAFVPVGRNADAKKVFIDILLDLGMYESQFSMLDERQLIDKLRGSLKNKRQRKLRETGQRRLFPSPSSSSSSSLKSPIPLLAPFFPSMERGHMRSMLGLEFGRAIALDAGAGSGATGTRPLQGPYGNRVSIDEARGRGRGNH